MVSCVVAPEVLPAVLVVIAAFCLSISQAAPTAEQLCSRPSDIVFVVDQSDPQPGSSWTFIQDFVVDVCRHFSISPDGTHVSLVTFDDAAKVRFRLRDLLTFDALSARIRSIPAGLGIRRRNIYRGLNAAAADVFTEQNGGRAGATEQLVILLTGGPATVDIDRTIPQAQKLNEAGIQVYCVGVTGEIDENQLRSISSPPHMVNLTYWTVSGFDSLSTLVPRIADVTCNRPKTNLKGCQVLDIAFAISIPQSLPDFSIQKSFLKQFLTNYLTINATGVRLSIVTYGGSGGASVQLPLNNSDTEDTLKVGIDRMSFSPVGNSYVHYAFDLLRLDVFKDSSLERPGVQQMAVVLVGSVPSDAQQAANASRLLQRAGVRVLVIGVGGFLEEDELASLASSPGDVVRLIDFSFLLSKLDQLANLICQRQAVQDASSCPKKGDIVLILDESTSIAAMGPQYYDNWSKSILSFTRNIANAFLVGPNLTQIGIVKFSTTATPSIYLDQYPDNDQLDRAIAVLELMGGETNIAAGLKLTREVIFSPTHGARTEVPMLAILMTDGRANRDVDRTLVEANLLKGAGVQLFCVGMTNNIDEKQLRELSSPPFESHYFYVSEFSLLFSIFENLLAASCSALTKATTSTTPATTTPTKTSATANTTATKTAPTTSNTETTARTTGRTTTNFDGLHGGVTSNTRRPGESMASIREGPTEKTTSVNRESGASTYTTVGGFSESMPTNNGGSGRSATATIKESGGSTTIIDGGFSESMSTNHGESGESMTTAFGTFGESTPTSLEGAGVITSPAFAGSDVSTTTTNEMFNESTPMNNGGTGRNTTTTIKESGGSTTATAEGLSESTPKSNEGSGGITSPASGGDGVNTTTIIEGFSEITPTYNGEFGRSMTSTIRESDRSTTTTVEGASESMPTNNGESGRISTTTSRNSGRSTTTILGGFSESTSRNNGGSGGTGASTTITTEGFRESISSKNGGSDESGTSTKTTVGGFCENTAKNNEGPGESATTTIRESGGSITTTVGRSGESTQTNNGGSGGPDTNTTSTIGGFVESTATSNEGSGGNDQTSTNTITRSSFETLSSIKTGILTAVEGFTSQSMSLTTTILHFDQSSMCHKQLDIVFLIDRTTNVNQNYFDSYVTQFPFELLPLLDIDTGVTQVAALTFSESPTAEFFLNSYSKMADIASALKRLSYGGYSTDLGAALRFLRTVMFDPIYGARQSPNVTRIAVVMTSLPSDNQTATLEEAALVRGAGITVIVVGIGTYVDGYELAAVASYPYEQTLFTVASARNLLGLVSSVKEVICSDGISCNGSPCGDEGLCGVVVNQIQCNCQRPGLAGERCSYDCSRGADIVFALDSSGSITSRTFDRMTRFVTSVIQMLDVDSSDGTTVSRVGLLTFARTVMVQFPLSRYVSKRDLLQACTVKYTAGETNATEAIRVVREEMFREENGGRPGHPDFLILMTDGHSSNSTSVRLEAKATRVAGINILVVGVTESVDYDELRQLASAPADSHVFVAGSFLDGVADNITNRIANILCQNIDACSSHPCQNGATCRSSLDSYSCGPCPLFQATGFNCERNCSGLIDLVFLIDSSGKIQRERLFLLKDFILSILFQLDVGPNATQVGLIHWSNYSLPDVLLDQYYELEDLAEAVRRVPYLGGRSNIAAALRLLRRNFFKGVEPDRSSAPNIAVLITNQGPTANFDLTIAEAVQAHLDGTIVVVVSVGADVVDSLELEAVASEPIKRNLLHVDSFRDLPSLAARVIEATCDDENECHSNPCLNNGVCSSSYGKYICACPVTFTGYNCQRVCNRSVDLVFVLDVSGSISSEYRRLISFSRTVTYGLDVPHDLARIGAVSFSTSVNGVFYMFQNLANIQGVVQSLSFYNDQGKTNLQAALRSVRESQLVFGRGDRPDVQNIVVVLSDGNANILVNNTVLEAALLKNAGVEIYSVVTGEVQDVDLMEEIASQPSSGFLFKMPQNSDGSAVAEQLLDRLCR